jgi:hypothetical protein
MSEERTTDGSVALGDEHEGTVSFVYAGRGIEVAADHDFFARHLFEPTGRSRWLCHHRYDSPFGPDHEAPETWADVIAPLGAQHGTFFKTSKVHDGMTVWLWGGRHPDDIASIVSYEQAHRRVRASR